MEPENIAQLIALAKNKDQTAITQLIGVFEKDVNSVAHEFRSVTEFSPADLRQEAWLRIWDKMDTFVGGADDVATVSIFRSWLRTTSRNLMNNLMRREHAAKRRPAAGLKAMPDDGVAEECAQTASTIMRETEKNNSVRNAIAQLSSEEQFIVRRCFFDGISLKELSCEMGLSYDQVRYRFATAIGQLKSLLDGQ